MLWFWVRGHDVFSHVMSVRRLNAHISGQSSNHILTGMNLAEAVFLIVDRVALGDENACIRRPEINFR